MSCWRILKEEECTTWPEKTTHKECPADRVDSMGSQEEPESISKTWCGDLVDLAVSESPEGSDSKEDSTANNKADNSNSKAEKYTLSVLEEELQEEEWDFNFEW